MPSAPLTSAPSPGPPSASPPAVTTPVLIAFTQIRRAESGTPTGAEVTTQAQFDRFVGGVADDQVRAKVQQHRKQGVRLFAFFFSGCQHDGASLVILDARLYAIPTGGENVNCFVAEYFLAVFAVPADRVPANVKIG
jgi:hypothetical protein